LPDGEPSPLLQLEEVDDVLDRFPVELLAPLGLAACLAGGKDRSDGFASSASRAERSPETLGFAATEPGRSRPIALMKMDMPT